MLLLKEALRSGTGSRVILWATAKNLDWIKAPRGRRSRRGL